MPYDPSQTIGIEQQRKLAEALKQQSMTPMNGQMVGNTYVAPSPVQGLARLAQAYVSKKIGSKADETEKAAKIAKNKAYAEAMKTGNIDPSQAAMIDPQFGMSVWQMNQNKQAKIEAARQAELARQRFLQDQEASRIRSGLAVKGLEQTPQGGVKYIPGSPEEQQLKTKMADARDVALKAKEDARRVKMNAFRIIGGGTNPETGKPYPEHPGLEAATGTSAYFNKLMPASTDMAQAAKRITEIKEQMQAVGKNMMPGLGSMAVQEWPKVEALISQIDPTADTAIVKEKIKNAITAFDNFTKLAEKKYEGAYSGQFGQYPQFRLDGGTQGGQNNDPLGLR